MYYSHTVYGTRVKPNDRYTPLYTLRLFLHHPVYSALSFLSLKSTLVSGACSASGA